MGVRMMQQSKWGQRMKWRVQGNVQSNGHYATVICVLDTGDIVGLKCRDLPQMSPGSAVDVSGFQLPAKIVYTV